MAILSKLKSIAKKVNTTVNTLASKAVTGAKNVVSKVSSAISKSNNSANVINGLDYSSSTPANIKKVSNALPKETKPSNTVTGTDASGTKYYNNYTPTDIKGNTTSTYQPITSAGGVGSKTYGPALPAPVSADPRTIKREANNTSSSVSSLTSSPAYASTLSSVQRSALGTGALSGTSQAGGSIGSLPTSGSSVARVANPDTTKLAGGMSGLYKYNATTGQYDQVEDKPLTKDQELAKSVEDRSKLFKQYLGVEDSVYNDKQVKAAMQDRNQLREALQAPTAELNSILAKQQQDLLQLRSTGAQEGVTEAVYGQQSNAVNYGAAVRALPLQASIANIQGQLDLAQDYLKELTAVKQDQISKQYEYNKQLFNSISGFLDKSDERSYNELTKENDRKYKDETDLQSYKSDVMLQAMKGGAKDSVLSRINEATDRASAVRAAGQYLTTPDTQLTQLDNGNTVLVDKRTGKVISNIGGAKAVAKPNLTASQSSDPFVQKLAASAGGKPITDTFAQKLDKGLTVLSQIGGLQANIKDVNTGPIIGAFKGANPWDTESQTIKAQLNAIVPNLARGVYGEVGVLTDNDVKQYSKTLPNLKSTEDIRNAVLGITVDLIGKSIKRTLEVNAANGKDVSGFADLYTEMQSTRDSIFQQIPGYKGESSNANVSPEIQSLRSKYNY